MELLYSLVFLLLVAVMIQQYRRQQRDAEPEKDKKRQSAAIQEMTPITFGLWTAYLIQQLLEKNLLEQRLADDLAGMEAAEVEAFALENGLVTDSDLEELLFDFHNQTPASHEKAIRVDGKIDATDGSAPDGLSAMDAGLF
ncbi:hypothetical protein [Bacillus marinisedimentorum]|uniref:hypothetical protein n=1 Tax=Bacillus marinisedimentorum TaxID=1821260 RepID=UPI000871F43B|nr:hypothetical protein [Bacillus marinisedimentorum]